MRVVWVFFAALSTSFFFFNASAQITPDIADYAAGREYYAAGMSADGRQVSIIHAVEDDDYLCVISLETRAEECLASVRGTRAEATGFVDDEHVIVIATERMQLGGRRNRYDFSNPYIVNVRTRDVDHLVRGTSQIYEAQTGFGRIAAFSTDRTIAYLPAFSEQQLRFDVFRVDIDTGRARRHARGGRHTIGWLMSATGDAFAREDYNSGTNEYSVLVPDGDDWRTIHSSTQERRGTYLSAVTPDRRNAVFVEPVADQTGDAVYYMSLETGDITGPFLARRGLEIEDIFRNDANELVGVRYSGMTNSYAFLDETLNQAVTALVARMRGTNVNIIDVSENRSRLLLHLSGDQTSGRYMVYDIPTQSFLLALDQRPRIPSEALASVAAVEYPARDGLTIPAILTWPPGADPASVTGLPLVVMPHGGPEAYDDVRFDWMAQAIAARGYMVLQPNFRGSSGFGAAFTLAGRGEWGGAMQDDVTDGVELLVREGLADPDRICIVGWSYGGYAALAGGAFTPELYACIASIAGVADLHLMLSDVEERRGDRSDAYSYWVEQFGQEGTRRADLRPISPFYHAEAFRAPVLLLHGEDDLIVPAHQSERMAEALEEAGIDVRLLTFPDQNHSIMDDGPRETLLREVLNFIDAHIGAGAE